MSTESQIDEAFASLGENLTGFCAEIEGEVADAEAGVRMQLEEFEVSTPVELDLSVHSDGSIEIGCAPPLFPVETTVFPVFHQIKFRAVAEPGLTR
jgi:hypothetical protein